MILRDGKIHLEMEPSLNDVLSATTLKADGTAPTSIPGRLNATVQLEAGQTAVLGGLLKQGDDAPTRDIILLVTPRLADAPLQRVH
jgi:Flp pilus assembly secretin CpaC